MGIETEYALAEPLSRTEALMWLMRLGHEHFTCLRGPALADMFLGNGSRIYLDCGEHPEVATPECTNPVDVVRYVAAGERHLERLCDLYRRHHATQPPLGVYKSNIDYSGAGTTWGCHESYLCHRPPQEFIHHLVPHLVSRIIYAGAGGFHPLTAGLRVALSPRVHHLNAVVSEGSTSHRGIFHTKDENLSRGRYHRLHLICGESLYSHIATYLKCGTTALVAALIDHGDTPGEAVYPADPLAAMRAFTEDETCSRAVPGQAGGALTAVGIQRHYLRAVQARLGEPWLPGWAAEVCREWGAMLDRLERGPAAVQTRLDWAIKLALFKAHAARRGVAWDKLPVLSEAAETMDGAARPPDPESLLRLMLMPEPAQPRKKPDRRRWLTRLWDHGLGKADYDRFRQVRTELFEIDLRCARLGSGGILAALDRSGVLAHGAPGVKDIDEAMHTAPPDTRAHARGAVIRGAPPRSAWWCTWDAIEDHEGGRVMNLADPFGTSADWSPCPVRRPELEPPVLLRARRVLGIEAGGRVARRRRPQ